MTTSQERINWGRYSPARAEVSLVSQPDRLKANRLICHTLQATIACPISLLLIGREQEYWSLIGRFVGVGSDSTVRRTPMRRLACLSRVTTRMLFLNLSQFYNAPQFVEDIFLFSTVRFGWVFVVYYQIHEVEEIAKVYSFFVALPPLTKFL